VNFVEVSQKVLHEPCVEFVHHIVLRVSVFDVFSVVVVFYSCVLLTRVADIQ